jgi:hypothetical protein
MTTKKKKKILKILKTITRHDELAKESWLKQPPANPNNEQTVFVLIHQKTGFVNAKLHHV